MIPILLLIVLIFVTIGSVMAEDIDSNMNSTISELSSQSTISGDIQSQVGNSQTSNSLDDYTQYSSNFINVSHLDTVNSDSYSTSSSSDMSNYDVSTSDGDSNTVVTVKDAYNKDAGNANESAYSDNGFIVNNAKVSIYDINGNLLQTSLTGSDGKSSFYLNPGDYTMTISYLTYKDYSTAFTIKSLSEWKSMEHMFVPDLCLMMYYGGHSEKINVLMDLSRRFYYIDTYPNFETGKVWMLDYANYVQLDMYTSGSTYKFDPKEVLGDTPANKNYKIAYTFGVYATDVLNDTGLNFIGASSSNNTPNTIENTYIGSYFQARDTDNQTALMENMKNYAAYISYLLGDGVSNPTSDPSKTPLLSHASWGIYHPDADGGIFGIMPSQTLINQWILADPGYTLTDGSLNWQVNAYVEWQSKNMNATNVLHSFETWYSNYKSNLNSNFVIVASYDPGGAVVDALIKSYESQGRAAFNVFQYDTSPSMASLLSEICNASSRSIVAINSLYSWSMDYNNMNATEVAKNFGAIDEFTLMNIEIIRGVDKISNYSYTSELGPQAEWTYAVTIPQFEGVFDAIVISYVDSVGTEIVIQSGVDKLVESTLGWVNLKEKNNSDKKVSIVLYNYPPGKSEMGASFLDVFQSTHDLLEQLSDAGYNIGMNKSDIPTVSKLYSMITEFGNKGSWAQGLLDTYVEQNFNELMANGQLIDLTQYKKYLATMNQTLVEALVDYWGSDLGKIMVYNNTYIVIPGIHFGNIFITFQPSRGWEEVTDYHSSTLPAHQQYVAFYKWMKYTFQADAIVNMGTHGTIEFLPGRSIGLQADDWTFELSGTPTIYPYIVSNPGEANVAKERLGALVISHMVPAYTLGGLYGNYTNLSNLITSYNEQIKVNSTSVAEEYKKEILEVAKSLAIATPTENQTFDEWLEDVDLLLDNMQNDMITYGLHTLGYVWNGTELIDGVIAIVASKTEVYNDIRDFLFNGTAAQSYLDDYYVMLKSANSYQKSCAQQIQQWFLNFVTELVTGNASLSTLAANYGISNDSELYEDLLVCVSTIEGVLGNQEWKAILTALEGGYVQPGLCVDPTYGESLSTGKNIYTTDSTKMPSKAAWEAGKNVVDKLIVTYYEAHGKFPELEGMVMWGTELLRTEGIGMAEFLYFLGVTPVWSKTGTVTGVKLIPLNELTLTLSNGSVINRPRIDCFASIVTSNPYWIRWMCTAVVLANDANEDTNWNFIKKHYAENPSLERLFGLPGNILEGTGISDLLPNTNKWENVSNLTGELVDIYMNRVSNSWSIDANGNVVVKENKKDYTYLLSKVDQITQNLDSTWRFLDSDDYYDWFGGLLIAAIANGAHPDTAIVDIRNKNDIYVRTLSEELDFEIRTMINNPKYIEKLMSTEAGKLAFASKIQLLALNVILTGGASDITGSGSGSGSGSGDNYLWSGSTGFGQGGSGYGISNSLINSVVDTLLNTFTGNGMSDAYSGISSMGWMIELQRHGLAEISSEKMSEMANKVVQYVNAYGVACCHHTCANLNFNDFVLQVSTLSAAEKQKYIDTVEQATKQKLNYKVQGATEQSSNDDVSTDSSGSSDDSSSGESTSSGADSSTGASSNVGDSSSGSSGSTGVSSDSGKGSTNAQGSTEVGENSAANGDSSDKSNNDKSDSSNPGQTGSDSLSDNSAYEVSKKSSSSSSQSSMPVAIIVCILAMVGLFGVGYIKKR